MLKRDLLNFYCGHFSENVGPIQTLISFGHYLHADLEEIKGLIPGDLKWDGIGAFFRV